MEDRTYDKVERTYRKMQIENLIILGIHIGLLGIFTYMKIWIMVCVNMVSVPLYIGAFCLISKRNYTTYLRLTYTEILVHMTMAIICLGWSFGFQLYCFAMIPSAYFVMYAKGEGEKQRIHSVAISFFILLVFIAGKQYSDYVTPIYTMDDSSLQPICYFFNCLISFGLLIVCINSYSLLVVESENELKLEADYDSLTGIYNRRRMQYLINEMYDKTVEESKEMLIVSILDIDDFKMINDTYGHDAGDYILRNISNMLTLYAKNNSCTTVVGRWGGEEFLILQLTDSKGDVVMNNLEQLRDQIRKRKFMYNKREIGVTVTIGMVGYQEQETINEMLRQADEYLYIGKRQGKNMVIGQ